MKHFYLIIAVLSSTLSLAQAAKKILFIGNSYTNTNNIPELTKQIATAAGDQLTYSSHTPGGSTLQQHNNNTQVTNLIAQGNWNYVVLQEQSQLPAFPDADVNNQVYPAAAALSTKIKQHNPCAKVTFYMTWGRKNGDPANCGNWPPLCTYLGMDNLLQQRYTTMATTNQGIIAPVAAVWRYLIQNNPEIELYSPDESHPSLAGSLASAFTFYTIFFEKSPNSSTYNNGAPSATINAIKNAVQQVVFNHFDTWKIYDYDPTADFSFVQNNNEFTFSNLSQNATTYLWDFGDGTTSTEQNPSHTYTTNGQFIVKISTSKCGKTVSAEKTIQITNLSIHKFQDVTSFLYPNPANHHIEFNTDKTVDTVVIIDANGRLITAKYSVLQTHYIVDLSQLPSGNYHLQIQSANETQSLPFIKK